MVQQDLFAFVLKVKGKKRRSYLETAVDQTEVDFEIWIKTCRDG